MASHNLALRGSIYWWRRKITVGGHSIALALSMRTGIFHEARLRSSCLAAEVEKLRMVYGQRGSAIDPATLKKIFSDALRWQLDRVLQDQLASGANPASHAAVNLAHAEVYRIFARRDARFTANDDERLAEEGWPLEARRMIADLWEDMRHHTLIPENQIKTYEARFGFQPTASNLERVRRTILAAKEAACREATKKLGAHPSDFAPWVCDGAGAGEVDSVAARALLLGDYPAQLCFGRYRSRLGRQRAGGGRRRALCTACRQRESRQRRDEKSGMPHLRPLVGSSCIDPIWQVRR